MGGRPPAVQLRLEHEAKLVDLVEPLDGAAGRRLEASGVLAKDDGFYVIFDNLPDIVRLGPGLIAGAPENRVFTQERREATGFEDIAYDPGSDRFFALIEALPVRSGTYRAKVHQYDGSLRYLRSDWLDFPLADANKGLEGLTCLRRNGRTCLLAMCEGNRCRGGSAGRRPGGGRIQVFTEAGPRGGWVHTGTIRLPRTLEFEDYSGISLVGDRLAVVSQASSALWVGRLRAKRRGRSSTRSPTRAPSSGSRPTPAVGPSTVRSRACRGWETIGWSWSPTRSSPVPGNGPAARRTSRSTSSRSRPRREGARP